MRWSDGSLQLLIGNEVLDVSEVETTSDHGYLYSRPKQATLLEVLHHTSLQMGRCCVSAANASLPVLYHSAWLKTPGLWSCSAKGSLGRRWCSGQPPWTPGTTSA